MDGWLNTRSDWRAEFRVQEPDPDTGKLVPSDATGWRVRIAASVDGPTIGDLEVAVVPRPAVPGQFSVLLDTAQLVAALEPDYLGQSVHVVAVKPGDADNEILATLLVRTHGESLAE